ncbi:MAG: sigma-70 family RNA polymerase sigma factor [Planctomycetes bacterium]|nr:sigma-70 family RNA polymerase sigma factor [Planctomycetota bacterium]
MSEGDSRSIFKRVQKGEEQAAREVFERYLSRLVALARSRLSEKLQQKVDAEDIVQSAFRSFFTRARSGEYTIERSGELWSLLAAITRHKLLKKAEHFRQEKRDFRQDLPLGTSSRFEADTFPEEPTVEEAVALSDELELLMSRLDPRQREMLELRLQGATIPAVAQSVHRSERTVRRFLGGFRRQLEERLQSLRNDE